MSVVNKKIKPKVKKTGKKNIKEVPISDKTTPKKVPSKSKKKVKKSQELGQVIDTKIEGVDKVKKKKKSVKKQTEIKPLEAPDPKSGINTPVKVRKVRKKETKKRKPRKQTMDDKKVFTLTEDRYGEIKDFYDKRGDEYVIVQSGTTEKIKISDKTYIPFNKDNMIGSGYHLANIVKADVKKFLEQYGDTFPKRGRDYTEQCFNLNSIEKNIGKVLISIDINDCYWQTIYNKGIISYKTYLSGLRKKEWKVGRNASIGSLAKVEVHTTMKNGVIQRDSFGKLKRVIIKREEMYQHVRHYIIGFVYDMFIELANLLGDDFFMFLTDCVFTTFEKKKVVEDFFKNYGYTAKCKTFEFTNVYRDERVVEWIELRKPDTPKYYRYSLGQLYSPQQNQIVAQ